MYLRDEYFAIQPEGYIEGSFDDRFLWKPSQATFDGTEGVVGLANAKHPTYFLVDNGNNAGKWAITAANTVNSDNPQKRVKITRNSGGSLKTVSMGNFSYYPDSPYLLGQGSGCPIYLFEYSNNIEAESFCFNPELKLYNGDKKEVSLAYSSPLAKVSGADLKSSGWELIGWYDSKLKNANMVLDSNGNVVGEPLELDDDRCLYAKWRSSSSVSKLVEVTDSEQLNNKTAYALVDRIGSIQYNKDQANKLIWNTVNVGNSVFVYGNGSHVDALGSSGATIWAFSGIDEEFTLSTKQSNINYYLGWKDSDNGKVLEAKPSESENPPKWKIEKDAETGEMYLAAIDSESGVCGYATFVHSYEGSNKEYVSNGTWSLVDRSSACPITFYTYQNGLYNFSWDRK